ncbi:MAG: hypothetical protein HYU74_12585 [Dechloromonas sp.]|nr:hypothetical protein [Dechloromonas sp.]
MPIAPLHVQHTVSYLGQPLMTVANLPGQDADMTPCAARRLAAALIAAAAECEALLDHSRRYGPTRRDYPQSNSITA